MKLNNWRKKYISVLGLFLLSVIGIGNFAVEAGATPSITKEGAFLEAQQEALNSLISRINSIRISYSYGSLVALSTEDLLRDATIIAIGEVTGKSKSYHIESTNGGRNIYTDTYFTISNVLKGEPYAETVSIRQEGGSVGTSTVIVDCEPKLKEGHEYLLFLYNTNCGGPFETRDDYYYICGLPQGTFVKAEDGEFYNIETNEPLPEKVFISPHLDEEVDEDYFRREAEEAYRNNLATGFITEEEYEQYMRELDVYATKIPRK